MTEAEIRKSAAERLAATRARLLNVVVDTLAETGYAAATTTEVAKRSGLTRGAQLHHFGTKDQMMLAAVEYLTERTDVSAFVAALDHLPPERDRLHVVLELLAELPSGSAPAAYAELWGASRSQPELADALRAADEVTRGNVLALFGTDILERAGDEFHALLDLTLYALRGMSIDAHVATDEESRVRKQLILGLHPYFEKSLKPKPRTKRKS
jgi:AcrR family transcriptional regulator